MKLIVLSLLSTLGLVFSAVALKNAICGLEYSKDGENGVTCRAQILSWSYKADTNECVCFYYGGCNGNDNRFDSPEECEDMCKE